MKSLRTLACDEIVKHDLVGKLKPVAKLLPLSVVTYLLSILDTDQFSLFHTYFPPGAKEERLFIEKYHALSLPSNGPLDYLRDWILSDMDNEVTYLAHRYWCTRLRDTMERTISLSARKFWNLSDKVYGFVVDLCLPMYEMENESVNNLKLFVNVQRMSFNRTHFKTIQKTMKIAKSYTHLKEIHFRAITCTKQLSQCIIKFLTCKISKQEHATLSFRDCSAKDVTIAEWLVQFGDATNGISGIKMMYSYADKNHSAWIKEYSKLDHLKKLELDGLRGVDKCLFDMIHHAPPRKVKERLSSLKLKSLTIDKDCYKVFRHWRFHQLEYFDISGTKITFDAVVLLAKHARFWPFVKHLKMTSCHLPRKGLVHLLPAMVEGDGCKNLIVLDISDNQVDPAGFAALGDFLNSENLKNLKAAYLNRFFSTEMQIPPPFLEAVHSLSLIELDMGYSRMNLDSIHQLLYAIFTKPQLSMQKLCIFFRPWEYDTIQTLHSRFHQLGNKSKYENLLPSDTQLIYGDQTIFDTYSFLE